MSIILTFLLLATTGAEVDYDEDISFPVPEVIQNHSPMHEPAPVFLTRLHNCSCREHPGKYVVCYGQPCRVFPAGLNISVPLFKLKLSGVTVLQKDDMLSLDVLQYLEIESNSLLEYIQPGVFRNLKNLQNLTISFNERLSWLEENTFEGLRNLISLNLEKNGFSKVIDVSVSLSPKYVPKLFLLRLNENLFSTIGATDFHPMNGTQLQQLNLLQCQIEYIHPDSLAPFKHLSTLRPGQNHFNSSVLANLIERSTELNIPLDNLNLYGMGFRRTPPLDLLTAVGRSSVRYLHLIVNHFDELAEGSFPYMPNVLQLSLRGNHITDIAPGVFKTVPKLESLLLTVNRLVEVPEAVLLPNLKELDLAGNTYSLYYPSYFYIPDEIFKNMSRLKFLTLAYNNICYLTKSSFVGLTNLTKLNLKNTSLTLIRSGTFLPLTNLYLLNLINNPFPRYIFLRADIFQGLINLQVLLLGGCSIRNLTIIPSLFTFTPSLMYLGLERNEIHQIGSLQFTPLIYLQTLNINENILPAWNKRILSSNSGLKTLYAVSNKFTLITTAMLEDWETVENLHLDGNPFTCDCSLYSVVLWYKNHKTVYKVHQDEEIIATCLAPVNWRHKSIVNFMLTLNSTENMCEDSGKPTLATIIAVGLVLSLLVTIVTLSYIYRYHLQYCMFTIQLLRRQKHSGNYIYDVYISYSQTDEWFLAKMVENLEPDLKLCIRERDLTIGELKPSTIAEAVSSSRHPVLVVSEEYIKSSWSCWETQLVARRTPIVVQLEAVDDRNASPLLRYLLKTRIYLLWPKDEDRNNRDVFWQKLKAALMRQ